MCIGCGLDVVQQLPSSTVPYHWRSNRLGRRLRWQLWQGGGGGSEKRKEKEKEEEDKKMEGEEKS